MEAAAAHFPWRQLGELLVAEELLSEEELEQALAEQAKSGRLLGQILVNNGYLSAFSLARVLSEQHGVKLQSMQQDQAPPPAPEPPLEQAWRPLGKVLVELEFLTESQLERALAAQREEEGMRLGEILVSRGLLSGLELAQALAEQHGVELEGEHEAVVRSRPVAVEEPVYKLYEVIFEPGYQRRTELFQSTNFLEAADHAFEFVDSHEPAALEIHRTHGAAQETVWNYSATRAAAVQADRTDLVETFGFDPTRWGGEL
ncbi:MAG TPA: hypothetical protein VFU26_12145 [Gaiellaceae bacterium]|nr:hypothetical protein [Gaiellaceae bacterium]